LQALTGLKKIIILVSKRFLISGRKRRHGMKTVTVIGITISLVCVAFMSGAWSAGLPDVSQQLKALQPSTDYKITDIVGKKLTVSDPKGAKSTLDGVDTQGLKVGDTLKGSALLEKSGQAPSPDKGALPGSIPKPSWK
jgi:hypothetical protein